MTSETITCLYEVQDKLNECRRIIDNHLYGKNTHTDEEGTARCREVYNWICKALDLL